MRSTTGSGGGQMDGYSLSKAMGDAIRRMVILAFLAGGAAVALLWFVGGWLFRHISIGWHP